MPNSCEKYGNILLSIGFYLISMPTYANTVYLQAKQYLDVRSGKIIQPANLLIENKIISAINPKIIPANATVIRRPELTLLPGLIDAHVHILYDLDQDTKSNYAEDDDSIATLRGVKNARTLLLAGFTTVRNMNQGYASANLIDARLAMASEKGWIIAPHIIPSGHAISPTGGHQDPDMSNGYPSNILHVSYRTGVADGVDEVVKAVRYQIKYGAKVIKVTATAGVMSTEKEVGAQQYSDEELQAVVKEANRHHIPVAAHAHGTEGINAAIKAGVSSIEHGSLLNTESIRLMQEHQTYLVPTSYILFAPHLMLTPLMRAKADYIIPLAKKNITIAIKAGVKIAFGTDSPVIPHGENAKEFSALVTLGMSPAAAIRAATVNAAELIRVAETGEIKTGFVADIIGVNGNPIDNIKTLENVKFVMKDGFPYKM